MNAPSLRPLLGAVAMTALLAAAPVSAQEQETDPDKEGFVLVLDVSNSMWGQVEKRAKIEIAREVVGQLLEDWPSGRPLGLMAYGHRKKQSCSDIELLLAPNPIDRKAMIDTVNELTPRGRTPLTEAVRQAAEALDFKNRRATVVLLSDGIESCNADPCALAEELEKANAETTVHVLGFDLNAIEDKSQLQCLADKTGGIFATASTADELAKALRRLSRTAERGLATLEALEQVDAGGSLDIAWTGPDGDKDRIVLVQKNSWERWLGHWVYTAKGNPAKLQVPDVPGDYELRYLAGDDRILLAALPIRVAPVNASLDAADTMTAADTGKISWTGPDNDKDRIAMVPKGAREGDLGHWVFTSTGNPVALPLPAQPGEYELRYVTGQNKLTLATKMVTVQAPQASLTAPEQANIGATVDITWQGPGHPKDRLIIVEKGAAEGSRGNWTYLGKDNPVKLLVPDRPGEYEVRYAVGKRRVTMARAPITLVAVDASLDAAPETFADSHFPVSWTGPAGAKDMISVVPAGAADDAKGRSVYVSQGNPIEMRMPGTPGDYELRYVTGQTQAVLARIQVKVVPPSATLDAPEEAAAGSQLVIAWHGPNFLRDKIVIVAMGKDHPLAAIATRDGNPARLSVPKETGDYELRYLEASENRILARHAITVVATPATLGAPDNVVAPGSAVSILWSGPGAKDDRIVLVAKDAADDETEKAVALGEAGAVSITAPSRPGEYELRYLAGDPVRILARRPVTIR